MDEAHVEHAVGLIQHEHLDAGEGGGALLYQIHQAAGRRDQDVAAGAQLVDLRALADAAKDDLGTQVGVLAVELRALGDLCRKLPRRRQDQRARLASLAGAQALQDRQHETGRLAGARLGACEHVTAGQHRRNGGQLDGGGLRIALFGHSSDQLGTQPESRKTHE